MREFQEIFTALRSGDWWTRKGAIEALLVHPGDECLCRLEEWLRNGEDALLRNASMEAYAALGARALESLRRLLRDGDEEMRIFAANLLGEIRDAKAFPDLVSAVRDPDLNVRTASVEALGKLADGRAVRVLAEIVEDEPWVTMAAIQALGEIGGAAAVGVLLPFLEKEEYRVIALDALGKAGSEVLFGPLKPFVGDEIAGPAAVNAIVNIALKPEAALNAGYFGEDVPRLIKFIGSPEREYSRAAFIALAWTEDERGLPYLLEGINSEELQECAIKGLIALGKSAVPAIVETLKNTAHANRVIFAKILSLMGENMALTQFADDEDHEVRTEVAIACGGLGAFLAGAFLSKMLDDPAEEVREAAARTLERLS